MCKAAAIDERVQEAEDNADVVDDQVELVPIPAGDPIAIEEPIPNEAPIFYNFVMVPVGERGQVAFIPVRVQEPIEREIEVEDIDDNDIEYIYTDDEDSD